MTAQEESAKRKELLREQGLTATKQRIALLMVLEGARQPISIEELTKRSKEKMNLVTGYRIIETLVKAGLARKVHFGDNRSLFESTQSHHHHVVCKNCDMVRDVDICLPSGSYKRALAHVSGFDHIEDHAIEFFGICTPCAQKH